MRYNITPYCSRTQSNQRQSTMASPSMEWWVDHYLDGPSPSDRNQRNVVQAMDVTSDFAELSYDGHNSNTIVSTPGSNNKKKQNVSTKQQQRYSKAEEPLSPVYVKQQHRDDKNDPAQPELQRQLVSPRSSAPKASDSVIQAFDILQAERHKNSPIHGQSYLPVKGQPKRNGRDHHRYRDSSMGGSVVSGLSSGVLSHGIAPLAHNKPSLSLVMSDVTETISQPPNQRSHAVQHHSILELCTEDLMSNDTQTVASALERLIEICGEGIQFTQCGGHAVLVGVMKKFSTHAGILVSACRLVQKLVTPSHLSPSTQVPQSISEQSRSSNCENAFAALFLAVNGLECIMKLMEHGGPQDDATVQAAKSLTQLLQVSSTAVERFLQSKHAMTYLRILREHRLSTNGTLCRLLYQMSTKENQRGTDQAELRQGTERMVNLIVAELNDCPDSRSVQVYGCATLANIFKITPECGNDGIPAILRSMKLFGNDEIVLERAIAGLFYCCRIPRHVDILKLQSGGLSTVSLALECFPKNAVIQSRGSEIIKVLLSSTKRRSGSTRQSRSVSQHDKA